MTKSVNKCDACGTVNCEKLHEVITCGGRRRLKVTLLCDNCYTILHEILDSLDKEVKEDERSNNSK